MKLFNDSTATILDNFQNAYFDQIKKRMPIGSEEYVISAIFSYVLATYTALMNKSYDNRFIDTAEGEYLDNIASQYNLSRSPIVLGHPYFEISAWWQSQAYVVGGLTLNIAGHPYKNATRIAYGRNLIRFVCEDAIVAYLDKSALDTAIKSAIPPEEDIIDYSDEFKIFGNGLQNCKQPLTDDDDFRKYIRDNRLLYSPGIAEAFEAVAKLYADYVTDAHVLRQNEIGFEPGVVNVLLKVHNDNDLINSFDQNGVDNLALKKTIEDMNLLTIGQSLKISLADIAPLSNFQVTVYVPREYESDTVMEDYVEAKHAALAYYYNANRLKIGETFYISEFINRLTKPLSEISNDPAEFGLSQAEFDKLDPFCIKGYQINYQDRISMPSTAYGFISDHFRYIRVYA